MCSTGRSANIVQCRTVQIVKHRIVWKYNTVQYNADSVVHGGRQILQCSTVQIVKHRIVLKYNTVKYNAYSVVQGGLQI